MLGAWLVVGDGTTLCTDGRGFGVARLLYVIDRKDHVTCCPPKDNKHNTSGSRPSPSCTPPSSLCAYRTAPYADNGPTTAPGQQQRPRSYDGHAAQPPVARPSVQRTAVPSRIPNLAHVSLHSNFSSTSYGWTEISAPVSIRCHSASVLCSPVHRGPCVDDCPVLDRAVFDVYPPPSLRGCSGAGSWTGASSPTGVPASPFLPASCRSKPSRPCRWVHAVFYHPFRPGQPLWS